eukprot:EG_transcript_2809
MHLCGTTAFLQSIWRPSAHQHSLGCFYRFVDPRLEAQYGHRSAFRWRAILRIYCAVLFFFAMQGLVDRSVQSPLFWTMFSVAISSMLLLLASIFHCLLVWALPVHAVYVSALSGVVIYHLRLSSTIRSGVIIDFICGSQQAATLDPGLYSRIQEQVYILTGSSEVLYAMFFNCLHWVLLSFAGWNAWTLLAQVAVFVASIVGLCANTFVVTYRAFLLSYLVLITLGFLAISIATERVRRSNFLAQVQLARELQASQLADGVLNHMLKNALADVAADIEIFLAGELGPEVLEDAVVCLRRGMRSCRARMIYLKMVAGEYVPVLNAINLQQFGQELMAGRNVVGELLDRTILMDGTLMHLILENALSNAAKHGHPDHPNVRLSIRMEDPKDDVIDIPGLCPLHRVSFVVQNVANPLRPQLTDRLVRPLLAGRSPSPHRRVVPALSDGVGLRHCALAARLGGITLELVQEGDAVTFTASVDAEVPDCAAASGTEDELDRLADQSPAGLWIFCLDDSASARRLLEFYLKRGFPSAIIRTFGTSEDDVDRFLSEALHDADVVILDQNLQYLETTFYGTDVCRQLVGHGFRGLVCIRSGDDSPEDQARYAASGAHCSFGKDVLGGKLVQCLKAAYVLNIMRPRAADSQGPRHPPPPRFPRAPLEPLLALG